MGAREQGSGWGERTDVDALRDFGGINKKGGVSDERVIF